MVKTARLMLKRCFFSLLLLWMTVKLLQDKRDFALKRYCRIRNEGGIIVEKDDAKGKKDKKVKKKHHRGSRKTRTTQSTQNSISGAAADTDFPPPPDDWVGDGEEPFPPPPSEMECADWGEVPPSQELPPPREELPPPPPPEDAQAAGGDSAHFAPPQYAQVQPLATAVRGVSGKPPSGHYAQVQPPQVAAAPGGGFKANSVHYAPASGYAVREQYAQPSQAAGRDGGTYSVPGPLRQSGAIYAATRPALASPAGKGEFRRTSRVERKPIGRQDGDNGFVFVYTALCRQRVKHHATDFLTFDSFVSSLQSRLRGHSCRNYRLATTVQLPWEKPTLKRRTPTLLLLRSAFLLPSPFRRPPPTYEALRRGGG